MAVNADARLWCEVLAAALHDAARGKDADWIGSADFWTVCELAGFDPEAVAQRFTPETYRRRTGRVIRRRVAHCGT